MTFREHLLYYFTICLTVWLVLAIQLDFLAVERDLNDLRIYEILKPRGYLKARNLLFVRNNLRSYEEGRLDGLNGEVEKAATTNGSEGNIDGEQGRIYGPGGTRQETPVFSEVVEHDISVTRANGIRTTADVEVASNQSYRKQERNSTIAPTATLSHTEIKDISKSSLKLTLSSKDVEIEEEIKRIKKNVQEINDRQLIRNENVFGPIRNDTRIFIVQVHKRLENLRYLVESLEKVRGITESLVILSHDFWDPGINDFVANITSFRVLQMFFPFSVQLHPNTFPGRDPKDCERNAKGKNQRCFNSVWPDAYGHYREERFTQIKHHWWWKIHRVFEDLQISKQWDGWIIFLEEDHFVAPDILYVLNALVTSRTSLCFHCRVICLGNYKLKVSSTANMVGIGDWLVTKQNMGFAMDRSAWNSIKACGEIFCVFDDYNWDWTMNRLVQTCCFPKLTAMAVDLTRVVHVGSCGTHIKEARCDVSKAVERAKSLFWGHRHLLFPKSFARMPFYTKLPPFKRPNGGWGDLRDRQLCKAIGNGTANEDTLLRLRFDPRPGGILQSREGR